MSRTGFATMALLLTASVICPAQPQFTKYPVQPAPSGYPNVPMRIIVGPDGNLWYTEYQPNYGANRIGRITTAGVMTEFPAKQGGGITVGPDGALWFVEWGSQKLGRITTAGVFTEVAVNIPLTGYTSGDITLGPDGNLWFLRDGLGWYSAMTVARMTPGGSISLFSWNPPANDSSLQRITAGPDGNLWVTEGTFGGIARVTPAGSVTRYPFEPGIPTPTWITFGPGGDIWVTESHNVRRIPFPPVANPYLVSSSLRFDTNFGCIRFSNTAGITTGPDGNMWIAAGAELIRIAPNATQCSGISYFPIPYPDASASSITTGCDGNLWYTDTGASAIGKVATAGPRVLSISSASADGVYLTGAAIPIAVTYSAAVTVTGTPRLKLNSGGFAVYTSGTGTNTLTFTYTVGAGDIAARLDDRWPGRRRWGSRQVPDQDLELGRRSL